MRLVQNKISQWKTKTESNEEDDQNQYIHISQKAPVL
jgi:hypothetical protein